MLDNVDDVRNSLNEEIDALRADKLALMEMLERCKEYITVYSWNADDAMTGRIADLLAKVRG